MDGIFGIEQGLDLDESSFKQAQSGFERPTTRTHDGDLVDDEWEVQKQPSAGHDRIIHYDRAALRHFPALLDSLGLVWESVNR